MTRTTLHLLRYELLAFLRNRQSQFFTLAMPVLFLVIFHISVRQQRAHHPGRGRSHQHVGVLRARHHRARDYRGLPRQPGGLGDRAARAGRAEAPARNPVPAAAIIAGRVVTAVVVAVAMAAILLGIGWAAYGAHVPGRTALAFAVAVLVGAASFCCLGYALTSFVRNEDAALPTTQALVLPLYFISGCSSRSVCSRTG